MTLTISIIAIIISLGTFSWTIYYNKRQLETQRFITSELSFVQIEQLLANAPKALKFHGINPDELKKIDVSPQEFAYLLSNFTAGGIFHRTTKKATETFPLNDYRGVMLLSKDTRKAWPVLKRLMGPSEYRDRIEKTIEYIEKNKL